ncbi:tetratricopeptide repeat protein 7B-like isoform X2 [Portunus trituberculatus]|uniref:tetratricopeptide repeat protein 7B-like isoform X2 n=1 Tax=Portunus trituberculatus TaxID=210409 RepID=UPI001E1D03CC|nr:tetratricopeptide repeat protein 7B-like isoform X2 [Portunus trituberculatus]
MSGKVTRGQRLETEIERSREESNWRKVIELAEHLKARNQAGLETLANFLIGEGKLESYLEEHPPTEANIPKAKTGLAEARKYLLMCIGEPAKKVSLDALLLLSKLEYAMGDYEGALGRLSEAGLDQLTEKSLPTRSLRIVAESYAIKGLCSALHPRNSLCSERVPLPNNSKYQRAEKNEKMIRCFELAGDLTLLYLQEQDKLTSTPSTHSLQSLPASNTTGSTSPLPPNGLENKKIGVILETALQRAPILYMKAGQLDKAITRYRSMLCAVESTATQHLRLTLARQLAEVLLRGCSEHAYKAPTEEKSKSSSSIKSGESPWKPLNYSGTNLFIPKNINEEIILLLLISEAMAVREAVLSQSPEFKNARVHAFDNATAVYDLLCISLARRKQYSILIEVFERAMKFSHEESHVWQQFGLALACGRKDTRALLVLQEVHRLLPNEPHYCLLAARVAFQQLGKIEEGLEWVEKALKCVDERMSVLSARCHLYNGLGHTLMTYQTHRHSNSQSLRTKSLESFLRAQQLDPSDHLAEYYLAFHYAQEYHVVEATHHVKQALFLRSEHLHSLHLLILLLSTKKEYEHALELAEAALAEYPENLHLMYVRASLEEVVYGGEVALHTARQMFTLWQKLYKEQLMTDISDVQSQHHANHDTHSMFNMSDKDTAPPPAESTAPSSSMGLVFSEVVSLNLRLLSPTIPLDCNHPDKVGPKTPLTLDSPPHPPTASVHAESVAASRVEQALSEVASSLSSYQPKPGPHQAWLLQIQIWLLTAQLYIKTDQLAEAAQCLHEASSIFPMSHHIIFMKGLLHEKKNEFHEAQTCYQNALAINPYHLKSLRHLGLVYHYLGSERLAEKTLMDAIKVDPFDHHSWSTLGEVMVSLGQLEASSKCLQTAIEMEAKSPILPFTSIPFCFE